MKGKIEIEIDPGNDACGFRNCNHKRERDSFYCKEHTKEMERVLNQITGMNMTALL